MMTGTKWRKKIGMSWMVWSVCMQWNFLNRVYEVQHNTIKYGTVHSCVAVAAAASVWLCAQNINGLLSTGLTRLQLVRHTYWAIRKMLDTQYTSKHVIVLQNHINQYQNIVVHISRVRKKRFAMINICGGGKFFSATCAVCIWLKSFVICYCTAQCENTTS